MTDMILLAMGDHSQRVTLRHLIRELNLEVREVTHGPQGIRDAVTLIPEMIIADDVLPYINGYQFCRFIKWKLHLGIPLILLLSSPQKMDKFWATTCRADYCLTKPVNNQEIKNIITDALLNKKNRRFFFQSPIIGQHTSDLDILKMANDLLDRHLFQEKLLNELSSMSRQVESVPELVSVMMSLLGSLFSYRSATVFIYHETKAELFVYLMEKIEQQRLDSLYASLLTHLKKEEDLDLSIDDIPITLLGQVRTEEQNTLDTMEEEDISIFYGHNLRHLLGYVAFDGLNLEAFPDEEVRVFHLILQEVMETLEEKIIFEKFIPFSVIDIVGKEAINRSFFLKLLAQNMEQARRFQIPLSLIILEMENYLQVLNSLGKKAGWHFRQKMYQALLNAIRKMDLVAKISENKFALVLFKANTEQAGRVYQRVKIILEALLLPQTTLLIKGGFGLYDASFGTNAEEFLSAACADTSQTLNTLTSYESSSVKDSPPQEEPLSHNISSSPLLPSPEKNNSRDSQDCLTNQKEEPANEKDNSRDSQDCLTNQKEEPVAIDDLASIEI